MEEPLALELRGLAIRPVYNETKKTFASCAMMGFISYNCLHISNIAPRAHQNFVVGL